MNYDSTQDRMDDATRAEANTDFNAFERIGKKLAASLPASSRFRVTDGMLEVLDDYLASRGHHGTKEEGQAALRQHFPDLTAKQIESCLRRWKKEMKDSGAQVSW
jgi:hypothetical protein